MAASRERVMDGPRSGRLALGDRVTFQARHLGLRWRLTARVSEYERPKRFVDEQEFGPFKRWHHVHHFTSDGRGGTVMHAVGDQRQPRRRSASERHQAGCCGPTMCDVG